jgi:hypothetical protein
MRSMLRASRDRGVGREVVAGIGGWRAAQLR